MSERSATTAINELLWSTWTELGVPGVVRRHRKVAIDPEPLVAFTPHLAAADPRLLEMIRLWCSREGEWLSKTRLGGLCRRAQPEVSAAFERFADDLQASGGRWSPRPGPQLRTDGSSWPPIAPPPFERSALAWLRMRALAGVGTRADVLCALLSRQDTWTAASELTVLGYSKRNIARVLDELAATNIAASAQRANTQEFRMRQPAALAALVGSGDLRWVRWTPLLQLAVLLDRLERDARKSPQVRRVSAHSTRDDACVLAHAADLPEPPETAGSETAFADLLAWGARAIDSLATEPALPASAASRH